MVGKRFKVQRNKTLEEAFEDSKKGLGFSFKRKRRGRMDGKPINRRRIAKRKRDKKGRFV